jgi:hypothetical protein
MNVKIVSNRYNENIEWIKNSNYDFEIIQKTQESNYGAESLSYLKFICENYDNLPDKIAFIHGHEHSYHQQYSIIESIEKYKNENFKTLNGKVFSYHYLNITHPWFPKSELNFGLFDFFWNEIMSDFEECPKKLIFCHGAQFIVDKRLILNNNVDFYKKIYNFILDKKLGKIISVFLEFVWHIIFTKNNNCEFYNKDLDIWCLNNKINVFIQNIDYIHIHKETYWVSNNDQL